MTNKGVKIAVAKRRSNLLKLIKVSTYTDLVKKSKLTKPTLTRDLIWLQQQKKIKLNPEYYTRIA